MYLGVIYTCIYTFVLTFSVGIRDWGWSALIHSLCVRLGAASRLPFRERCQSHHYIIRMHIHTFN